MNLAEFDCPRCGQRLSVECQPQPTEWSVTCPNCQNDVKVEVGGVQSVSIDDQSQEPDARGETLGRKPSSRLRFLVGGAVLLLIGGLVALVIPEQEKSTAKPGASAQALAMDTEEASDPVPELIASERTQIEKNPPVEAPHPSGAQDSEKAVPASMGKDLKPILEQGDFRPGRSDNNRFAELWAKHRDALVLEGHSETVLKGFTNPQLLGNQLVAIHPHRVTFKRAQKLAQESGAKILHVSNIEPLTILAFTEWSRSVFTDQTLNHWRMGMMSDDGVCGIPPFGRREIWPLKDEHEDLRSLFLFSWRMKDSDPLIRNASVVDRPIESDSLDSWKKFIVGEWEVLSATSLEFTTRHVFFADGTVQRWQDRMKDPRLLGWIYAREPGPSWKGNVYRWNVTAPGEIAIINDQGKDFDQIVVLDGFPAMLKSQKHGTLVKVDRAWGRSREVSPYEFAKHAVGQAPHVESAPVELKHHNQGRTYFCVGFSVSMALQQTFGLPFGKDTVLSMCGISTGGDPERTTDSIGQRVLLRGLGIPYQPVEKRLNLTWINLVRGFVFSRHFENQ
ncbi:MAG: hypothetical protein ABF384_19035 [Verrucomicrobiales bacterium]